MSRIPDPQLSRAVLIGTSDYERSDQLPNLPAVRNNLSGLERVLVDPLTGVFLPQHCSVVDSPDSPRSLMRRLTKTADAAEDVLLVYYAGHGTLDRNGDLQLTVRETDPDPYRIEGTAVPFIWIRRVVEDSPARVRVLILDCCFSGQAIGAMSPASAAFQQIQVNGTYILTSSEADKISRAIPGERYTAFTGELLVLLSGPPTDPAITLSELNRRLRAALARRDLPSPRCRADSTCGDLILRREWQPAVGAPLVLAAAVVPKPSPETRLPPQQPPLTQAAAQPKSRHPEQHNKTDTGSEPVQQPTAPVPKSQLMAAPNAARLIAFALDLAVVGVLAFVVGATWETWPIFLIVFVAYHTALVWLTGQTIGKALANLAVRRIDGSTYVRTWRGLWWVLGRTGVGYLVVDVFGLGLLVALRRGNPARRCLHDWVFASQVVLCEGPGWVLSKLDKQGVTRPWPRAGGRKSIDAVPTTLSPKAIAGTLAGTAAVTGTVLVIVLFPAVMMPIGLWGNDSINPADKVGEEISDPGDGARRESADSPSANFTEFRNEEAGIALSYPSSWAVQESNDPGVLLLASDGPERSFLLRAVELPNPVGQQELEAAKQGTDQIVGSNETVEMLVEPRQLELGGLPGYWYVYSFQNEPDGQRGAHSHYFIFKGKTMIILVFQTVPIEKFAKAAPIFDQIAGSLRVLNA